MGIKITGSSFTGRGGRSFSFEVVKNEQEDNKFQELENKVQTILLEASKEKPKKEKK